MTSETLLNDPLARIRALQSTETRARLDVMQRVKARFLRTQRYDELEDLFKEYLDDLTVSADPKLPAGAGNRREGSAIVLVGESGAGKSHALKRMVARHPAFPGYCVPRSGCQAVYVRVPSSSTYKAVARITLRQLGLPLKGNPPAHIVWEKVYERIDGEALGVLVLHFDEMHNVLKSATEDEIEELRNVIKTLVTSPTWPILVLISGLPDLLDLTQPITEISRRCTHVQFAALRLPDDIVTVEHALSDLVGVAGLALKTTPFEALVPRLIHASLYQLGTSVDLMQKAIFIALKGGTTDLTIEHFARAFAGRTGCVAPDNPFLAPDWIKTDCTKVLGKSSPDEGEEFASDRRTRHGSNSRSRSR
jgi:hypothetical protein